jgi:hypothetical protein
MNGLIASGGAGASGNGSIDDPAGAARGRVHPKDARAVAVTKMAVTVHGIEREQGFMVASSFL